MREWLWRWMFQVNLTNSSDVVCLDDYNKSGEWDIVGSRVEQKHFSYSDDPGMRFSKIAATINMQRRHRYYTLNLILPCAMLSSLTLVTFLSPPDQGEKISLGISILLSFSVFMLSLSENLPKTSETIPLFGQYVSFLRYSIFHSSIISFLQWFVPSIFQPYSISSISIIMYYNLIEPNS